MVGAIRRVRPLSDEIVSHGKVVLAVLLDIANAFNSLPWECIRQALRFHRVSAYMQKEVGTTFGTRASLRCGTGRSIRRRSTVGLGSRRARSWNRFCGIWATIESFEVLFSTVYYADNILFLVLEDVWRSTICLAEVKVAHLVRRVDLEMALVKIAGSGNSPPKNEGHLVCRASGEGAASSLTWRRSESKLGNIWVLIKSANKHVLILPT